MELLQTIGIAIVMFAATNADDLVLLTIFFGQPNASRSQIVLGQLAGIGALAAISYTASSLALAIPHGWLPWIGIFPLLIGVRWLFRKNDEDSDTPPEAAAWWTVAGITMANGADNLGVYIPSFALQTGIQKVITGATFLVLTLVWCVIAAAAVQHPKWGPCVSRVCRIAAPFVLIGIGAWIVAHHPVFGLSLTSGERGP
jgi:cadmium resistance protein CadD (predicted permease)